MSYVIPARLAVVARPGSALGRFWKDYYASPYRVEGLPASVQERLPAPDGDGLLLILTDDEATQRQAVRLKLRRRAPVIVMRWWDARPGLRRTLRNRLVFNRYTGVNFLQSREGLPPRGAGGAPGLDNPVVLDQGELLGPDAAWKMMRHTLLALTQPARIDAFGARKRNYGHLRLAVATHFYCNQRTIDTVTSLLEEYAAYPADVLERTQFVVVDDGSPVRYEVPALDLNLTWLRVEQDIRWNQAGARNLALLYARSNNVVISDVDHSFPTHTLRWLIGRDAPHRRFYRFYRKRADGSLRRGHPNLFYLSRARFFQLFGPDEEFAGAYGAEDVRFVRNFKYHGTVQLHVPKKYYCVERTLDRAASYHSLARDLSHNTGVDTRKRMEIEYFGADFGHSRSSFNFTWTVLADYERKTPFTPPLDRGWRQRWWLRQLAGLLSRC
ncbi:MAG TPA: glycosyltransferase [Burkholderiales bacterium]